MAVISFTITSNRLRIPNSWVRDIVSEILATYVFVLLSIGVMAQEVVGGMGQPNLIVVNLSISIGLIMAIYVSGNASGGYVNPGIALCMCLTGYLQWRKLPTFFLCYFLGAFLGAATVYGLYYDSIQLIDGGHRQVAGENGTGIIFTSFPNRRVFSKGSAFVEVVVASTLLVVCTLALADKRNLAPAKGFVPVPIGLSVFTICSGFSHQAGCPINAAKDLAPRFLLLSVGYGPEAFSYGGYWFWIPLVASVVGSFLATVIYQLCIGVQWEPVTQTHKLEEHDKTQKETSCNKTDYSDDTNPVWSSLPSGRFRITAGNSGGYRNPTRHFSQLISPESEERLTKTVTYQNRPAPQSHRYL